MTYTFIESLRQCRPADAGRSHSSSRVQSPPDCPCGSLQQGLTGARADGAVRGACGPGARHRSQGCQAVCRGVCGAG